MEIANVPPSEAAGATARRDDLYLAALRGYVEQPGGQLVLTAEFPAGAPPAEPAAVSVPVGLAAPLAE